MQQGLAPNDSQEVFRVEMSLGQHSRAKFLRTALGFIDTVDMEPVLTCQVKFCNSFTEIHNVFPELFPTETSLKFETCGLQGNFTNPFPLSFSCSVPAAYPRRKPHFLLKKPSGYDEP